MTAPAASSDHLHDFESPADVAAIRARLAAGAAKVVVLDDDPTGTQTMHDFDVLTEWSVPPLTAALRDERPCFFLLTNTRAMDASAAIRVNEEIAANLRRGGDRFRRPGRRGALDCDAPALCSG